MRRLRRAAQLAILAALPTILSCASDATTAQLQEIVNTVVITLGTTTLAAGQSVDAAATARNVSGGALDGVSVSWSSSNSAVATVTPAGRITAVSPGTAHISAAAAGKTATVTVTVMTGSVTAVNVALSTSTVFVGQTATAQATLRDAANAVVTDWPVTWSSSNAGVAVVSPTGAITPVSAGTTEITAASEGVTGSATLTVLSPAVASVSVALVDSTLVPGQITGASATVRDHANAIVSGVSITWSSSNISVASVTSEGVVTAVMPGSVTITAATPYGVVGTAAMTVQAPVAAVAITVPSAILSVGKTMNAAVTLRDASGNVLTDRQVIWTSRNPSIATVSASGTIAAVSAGRVTILATTDGSDGSSTASGASRALATVSGLIEIWVQPPPSEVIVNVELPTMRVGMSTNVAA
ncbi:MAG TPA: Ig-like domain-containing protein, partial [Gemmatimonadaceae bacterium]